MVKTTVYLSEDLKRRLEHLARAQGRSEADVIRTALDEFTAAQERPRPKLPLFSSLGEPIADRVDEILAEGFGIDPPHTSGLLAAIVEDEPSRRARRLLEEEPGPLILPPSSLPTRLSARTPWASRRAPFLDEVAAGAYDLSRSMPAVGEAREVIAAYADQEIGLADASLVFSQAATNRARAHLDERHFRALRSPAEPFSVLPADA